MKRLDGQLALVTGSSRGIGAKVAEGLADRGCDVILHGRTIENTLHTKEIIESKGVKVYSVEGELSSVEGVNHIIHQVKKIGHIDILYNNAGISNQYKPIFEYKVEDWQEIMQVNVYSLSLLCSAFAPAMKEKGYGRIVNVSSGIQDQPHLVAYSVSKAAVDKYTKDLSFELKDVDIKVSYIDPGWIKTDLGGPNAENDLSSVLPGMLIPVLLEKEDVTGQSFRAQDYRDKEI
ncbi:SDR family NAD(P)-dependent oxidoreductase [Chengkuizengella sediminis]|uniref:SDR family NAD(P)-dependent oxidoreductase n=1 Tax=Chengkuizengella sediminis TaxID=1885917 RepID=UPI0013897649|nr:SDR family oxidoreductase [Chengkuizengella sediminis]NDI36174.1 SDR family oxidoreductase [Chengkuizengella sediminis]